MKLADLKPGQRVRVTVEGVVSTTGDPNYVRLDGVEGKGVFLGRKHPGVTNIEVLPEPLKVGDRVKPGASRSSQKHLRGEIRYIDEGDQAVVRWTNSGYALNIWNLSNLEKADDCEC